MKLGLFEVGAKRPWHLRESMDLKYCFQYFPITFETNFPLALLCTFLHVGFLWCHPRISKPCQLGSLPPDRHNFLLWKSKVRIEHPPIKTPSCFLVQLFIRYHKVFSCKKCGYSHGGSLLERGLQQKCQMAILAKKWGTKNPQNGSLRVFNQHRTGGSFGFCLPEISWGATKHPLWTGEIR